MRYYILTGSLSFVLAAAALAGPPPPGPTSGLEKVVGGAVWGMPFVDFVKAHPDAAYSDPAKLEKKVDPAQPGGLLESYDKDPFLGLTCTIDYGFRDAKLYEFVAMWSGETAAVDKVRESFFRACVVRHGKNFKREAMRLRPNSDAEELIPVFCWEENHDRVLAYTANPAPGGAPPRKAVLNYSMFSKDDTYVASLLVGSTLSVEKHAELWKKLDSMFPPEDAKRP
jgi:hypothetical protein